MPRWITRNTSKWRANIIALSLINLYGTWRAGCSAHGPENGEWEVNKKRRWDRNRERERVRRREKWLQKRGNGISIAKELWGETNDRRAGSRIPVYINICYLVPASFFENSSTETGRNQSACSWALVIYFVKIDINSLPQLCKVHWKIHSKIFNTLHSYT